LFSDTDSIGEGGYISVKTGNLLIADGGTISTESRTTANAGTININSSKLISLDNGTIKTNAERALGGDITASSQVSGKEGKISVNSPVQDIVNAMVPLRESFLNADELLPERCETRDPEQAGSFIVDSDEGLPPRPDELLR
jgi:large exoprotein involved in heme utilization and adhesion